jgi:hypothetical protein
MGGGGDFVIILGMANLRRRFVNEVYFVIPLSIWRSRAGYAVYNI